MAATQPAGQEHHTPQQLPADEMNLREHLLAAQAANQAHAQAQAHAQRQLRPSDPQHAHLDPAFHSPWAVSPGGGGLDGGADGKRKGHRELSQSKRAAQNRAAQRAFRQRKEGYIKKLEDEVRSYVQLEEAYHKVQHENHHFREYVNALQSRLMELQGDCPPPPPEIDLNNPPSRELPGSLREQMNGSPTTSVSPAPASNSGENAELQLVAALPSVSGAPDSTAPPAQMTATDFSHLQAAAAAATSEAQRGYHEQHLTEPQSDQHHPKSNGSFVDATRTESRDGSTEQPRASPGSSTEQHRISPVGWPASSGRPVNT